MSYKLKTIFTFILVLQLTQCEDWCPQIKLKDQFRGLGVYHRFYNSKNTTYIMFVRDGNEWEFKINRNKGFDIKDMKIEMINNSLTTQLDKAIIVNRYGYCIRDGCRDCQFLGIDDRGERIVRCAKSHLGPFHKSDAKLKLTPEYSEFVLMKAYPSAQIDTERETAIVLNKKDRSQHILYSMTKSSQQIGAIYQGNLPEFITQVNVSLFESIDGIVDYNFGPDSSGWLVVFNINERPYYCFTAQNKKISEECNSVDKMKPLFEECFVVTSPTTTTTTTTTPKEDSGFNFIPIVITILGIIITIIIIIVCLVVCHKNKKYQIEFPTSTTGTESKTSSITGMTSVTSDVSSSVASRGVNPKSGKTIHSRSQLQTKQSAANKNSKPPKSKRSHNIKGVTKPKSPVKNSAKPTGAQKS